ncbi:MAG: ABC transporter permease [Coprococcus phoceensis]
MNILNELTVKNLKRNKKRTLVTIFGIILSVALVTAITTFVSSMQGSMIEYAKKMMEIIIFLYRMCRLNSRNIC